MKKLLITALLLLSVPFGMRAAIYDVREFGARADGKSIDSPAINRAIEQAAADGGGTVVLPAGTYLCYTIRLQSNIEMRLERGATILAATPTATDGYDAPEPAIDDRYQGFGHNHVHNSLIRGVGLRNIAVVGEGVIDGSALDSWTEGLPRHGNKGVGLRMCSDVRFEGVTFLRCGHFALHLTGVDNLHIENVTVDSDRDGIDIICCKNVVIENCRVNTPQDDGIVLKSTYTLGYFRDVENVTISGCAISGYRCGTLVDGTRQRFSPVQDEFRSGGRIKLGTESSGGYRNITVRDCTLDYCGGILLQSMDGGVMENVTVEDITIRDGLSSPIFIRLGARMRSPEGTPVGSIRHVELRRIRAFNAPSWNACIISGIPGHCVEEVTLRDIDIHYQGGFSAQEGLVTPPEFEKDYPEPWMFGTSPAKGFYIRHARGIRFENVHFHYRRPDARPLFVESDTEWISYRNISVNGDPETTVSHKNISLNGQWLCGIDREYRDTTDVPGIATDPARATPGVLWYKREVELPEGSWNRAVVELNGARFRPSVHVDGRKVSDREGGMAKTVHPLPGVKAGSTVTLEIALQSLDDVPTEDASFIPKVDQWRSNCSSGLWDDVTLILYTDARVDRVLTYSDTKNKSLRLKYRVRDGGASQARLSISDGNGIRWSGNGPAAEGENELSLDYGGLLTEWTPEHPVCYELCVELLSAQGNTLSSYRQTLGIREMSIREKRFRLNGEPIRPAGGSIVWHRWVRDENARKIAYDTEWIQRNVIDAIRERGGNYLRFHLGVPPERILDLCDRAGLMVQYEWSFFHGMPASYESLVEQYAQWLDLASRHPSVLFFHPYNETSESELARVWQALNRLCAEYPPIMLEGRDITHIHRYWWGMSENLGLYYDSYKQFAQPIIVDEFGGFYLDEQGNMGAYPMLASAEKRWLGLSGHVGERLRHQCLATGKLGEYWRMIGAAGIGAFAIASSYEDGNNWYLGDLQEGRLKPVWDAMTPAWSPRTVLPAIWNRNYTPGQKVSIPLHFINDTAGDSLLEASVELRDSSGRTVLSRNVRMRVGAGAAKTRNVTVTMPEACGSYTIAATLLNPGASVKRPVTSKWEIEVLRVRIPERVRQARIYIPRNERELRAMAAECGLNTVQTVGEAEVILTGAGSWKNLSGIREGIDNALRRGCSAVMLDVGGRYLGKQYADRRKNLGQEVRPTQTSTEAVTTDIVAGLSLHTALLPEGESFIHQSEQGRNLWYNLKPQNTRLWNGMRGGLMVPAEGMELHGLSQEAFLNQWTARGADSAKICRGNCFAYEHCGFYDFSDRPDDKAVEKGLKEKVRFLIEDMPALDLSFDKNAPVRVTDLHAGYLRNRGGRARAFIPLVTAGKDLVRTPVNKILFGENEGVLILSQLLTAGRLADGFAPAGERRPAEYDEAAVQFVINLLNEAIDNPHNR